MEFTATDGGWFIPEFNGNRTAYNNETKPDDEIIQFELDLLTSGEVEELESKEGVIRRGVDLNVIDREVKILNRIVSKRVTGVRGVKVRNKKGDLTEPLNGKQFLTAMSAKGLARAKDLLLDELEKALKDSSTFDKGSLEKLKALRELPKATTADGEAGDADYADE